MKNWNALLNTTDEFLAEDSNINKARKSRVKAAQLASFGNTKRCRKTTADNGRLKVFVKPGRDIMERLEHYLLRYPDAKIVK
jgi:hypothetical protein